MGMSRRKNGSQTVSKYYLEALLKELRGAISRLDAYVAEGAGNPVSSE